MISMPEIGNSEDRWQGLAVSSDALPVALVV